MDKVCLLVPHFTEYDGITQLVRRYVHASLIHGIKAHILCQKWEGFIPEGWTLGKVTHDKFYEIEVFSIKKDRLYCFDTKEEALKVLEGCEEIIYDRKD